MKKRIKITILCLLCVALIAFLLYKFIKKGQGPIYDCDFCCKHSYICTCPEYMCYEKEKKENLQKCKNRCKIKIRKSYNSCISECEQEFRKDREWIN